LAAFSRATLVVAAAAAKLHYGCGSLVPRRFLALV